MRTRSEEGPGVSVGSRPPRSVLVTGASGVAMGLPANFIAAGLAPGWAPSVSGAAGPEAILAGSCSRATREQIERHRQNHPVLAIDVDGVEKLRAQPRGDAEAIIGGADDEPFAGPNTHERAFRRLLVGGPRAPRRGVQGCQRGERDGSGIPGHPRTIRKCEDSATIDAPRFSTAAR